MADPGFPVGGAPTSNAYAFWRKCMRKRKNWILLGERRRRPLDPPMKLQQNTGKVREICQSEKVRTVHNNGYTRLILDHTDVR